MPSLSKIWTKVIFDDFAKSHEIIILDILVKSLLK